MRTPLSPPRLAEHLMLRALRSPLQQNGVLGDLREEYARRRARSNRLSCDFWFWRQAVFVYWQFRFEERIKSHNRWQSAFVLCFTDVGHDIRFAARTLYKRPLFTAVAVLTLGLGIGAATAMFSVVQGVLIRPLSYAAPGELVNIWGVHEEWRGMVEHGVNWDRGRFNYEAYVRLRDESALFQEVAIHDVREVTVTEGGEPDRVAAGMASISLLSTLGVQPALGRWFLPGEEATVQAEAAAVTVISDEFWRTRFATDPDVLGKNVVVDGVARTVIGVLPPGFRVRRLTVHRDAGKRSLWIPICRSCGPGVNRTSHDWEAIARLAPTTTADAALAETRTLLVGRSYERLENLRIVSRKADETRGLGSPLVLLLVATGLLLVIACGNIATLLLGEMNRRRQELATRVALGAQRGRILRQLLTESLVVGVMGSVVGTLIAVVGTRILTMIAPPIPRVDQVGVNVLVLCFAIGLGLLAGVSFGALPAAISTATFGRSPSEPLTMIASRRSRFFERLLLSLEIALCTVLLVSGGLFVRSLRVLLAVNPGFDTENLATVQISVPSSTYRSTDSRVTFLNELTGRLEAIPGVVATSIANGMPFSDPILSQSVDIEGVNSESAEAWDRPVAMRFHVMPGYFETMGMPLLTGRTIEDTDGPAAPSVMVISESMARRYWSDESPIGARVRFWNRDFTVVGIVGDVKRTALDSDFEETFYVSLTQVPRLELSLVVRTAGDPLRVVPLLRQAVGEIDANLPVTNAGTMSSFIERSASDFRYRTMLMGVFGVFAAMIATVGVFGVTARAVALRTRELGVRIALGARQQSLTGLVLRSTVHDGLVGTSVGLLGAIAMSRLISGFLFGVDSWDPLTYVTVAVLLMTTCLVASYLPARRITRIDPVNVLRAE